MTGRGRSVEAKSRSDRLRTSTVILAGSAGAALGILLGLVWQLTRDGNGLVAVAVGALALSLGIVVFFQLVQARAVVALLEGPPPVTRDLADLERRLSAVEEQLNRLPDQV